MGGACNFRPLEKPRLDKNGAPGAAWGFILTASLSRRRSCRVLSSKKNMFGIVVTVGLEPALVGFFTGA